MKIDKKQEVKNIIEILSLRKKQFVSVKKSVMNELQNELSENYPKAKFSFFGLGSGSSFNVIRTSSADTFKCVGAK